MPCRPRHKNIRAFGYIRQILSFGMCNFNRCIFMKRRSIAMGLPTILLLPITTAFFADGIYTCRMDKFHYSGRSAGQKMIIAYHNCAHINGMKSIHIFYRIYAGNNLFIIQMLRKRKLAEYAADFGAGIKLIHQII